MPNLAVKRDDRIADRYVIIRISDSEMIYSGKATKPSGNITTDGATKMVPGTCWVKFRGTAAEARNYAVSVASGYRLRGYQPWSVQKLETLLPSSWTGENLPNDQRKSTTFHWPTSQPTTEKPQDES